MPQALSYFEMTDQVIGASIEVHKQLGPGLLESVYEHCLAFELRERGFEVLQQHPLPVHYKAVKLDLGFRLDLWVDRKLVLEVKAVEALNDIHLAQVLTYLKLTDNRLGLLINFNVPRLKEGIRRVANNFQEPTG